MQDDWDIPLFLGPRLGNLTAHWDHQCGFTWDPVNGTGMCCHFLKLRSKIEKHWWHMVAGSSDATVAVGWEYTPMNTIASYKHYKLKQMWETRRSCTFYIEKPFLFFCVYVTLLQEQQKSKLNRLASSLAMGAMARIIGAYPIGCSHTQTVDGFVVTP